MRRILLTTLAITAGLLFATAVSLPPLASALFIRLLSEEGLQTELRDMDIDWLHGELTLWQLKVRAAKGFLLELPVAHIAIEPRGLASRRLVIEEFTLERPRVRLPLDEHGRPLLPLPASSGGSSAARPLQWQVGLVRLALNDARIHLQGPEHGLELQLPHLGLQYLYPWASDQPARLEIDARINGAAVGTELSLWPLSTTRRVQGQVHVTGLDLGRLTAPFALPVALQGRMDSRLQVEARHSDGGTWTAEIRGPLSLQGLEAADAQHHLSAGRLALEGDTRLTGSEAGLSVHHEGHLVTDHLALGLPPWQGRLEGVELPSARLTLRLPLQDGEEIGLRLESDLDLRGGTLSTEGPSAVAARISRLQLQQLTVALPGPKASFASAVAEGLELPGTGPDKAGTVGAGRIEARAFRLADNRIDLDRLAISDGNLNLVRKAGNTLVLPRIAQVAAESGPDHPDSADNETRAADTPRIHVNHISIQGHARFEDQTISPEYRGDYELRQLKIGTLDTARPQEPVPLELSARLHRYARLELKGKFPLLAWPPENAEADWSLHDLELPRLNPYLIHYTGYRVRSGNLDIGGHPRVSQSILQSRTRVRLSGLKLQVARPERAAHFDQTLGIGLEPALAMIRDRKGNIKLELPLTGNLADPDFDPAPIIAEAMKTALTHAATAYTVYAIQPYGAALLLTQVAGKTILKLHFDPIAFTPGQTDLPPDRDAYLDKLAALLKERPGLELAICGVASTAERAALPEKQRSDQVLIELARQRAYGVKDALMSRGIEGDRLRTCAPRIDDAADGKPRVELES